LIEKDQDSIFNNQVFVDASERNFKSSPVKFEEHFPKEPKPLEDESNLEFIEVVHNAVIDDIAE